MSESLVFDLINNLSELPKPGDVAETLISCRTCFREQVVSTPGLLSGSTFIEFDAALLQLRVADGGEKDVSRTELASAREPEVVDPAGDDPVEPVNNFLLNCLDEVVMWLVDFLEKLSRERTLDRPSGRFAGGRAGCCLRLRSRWSNRTLTTSRAATLLGIGPAEQHTGDSWSHHSQHLNDTAEVVRTANGVWCMVIFASPLETERWRSLGGDGSLRLELGCL
ncbi:MAG: hypothetical protein JWP44_4214 [Mucilaginibacter sp.]|nr:hypothetical protein [Mucilaginibacter sp.]